VYTILLSSLQIPELRTVPLAATAVAHHGCSTSNTENILHDGARLTDDSSLTSYVDVTLIYCIVERTTVVRFAVVLKWEVARFHAVVSGVHRFGFANMR